MPRIGSLILLVSCLWLFPVMGKEKKKNDFRTTKEAMNEIFQSFVNLLPYASSEIKWRDPQSEKYIIGNLSNISHAFKNARHLRTLNKLGFKPSYDVVNEHLAHTLEAFQGKNKIFARTRLKATTQMCMSCHTQLSSKGKTNSFKAINNVERSTFKTSYEYADFLFLVRKYNKSIRYYKKEIDERIKQNKQLKLIHSDPSAHFIDYTIEKSLRRMVTIYTKIFYNPEKAIKLLGLYQTNAGLSKKLLDDIQDWLKDLRKWTKKKEFKSKLRNEAQLIAFLKKHLEPLDNQALGDGSSDIDLLIASGVLYRYLNLNPKSSSVPTMLYWLASIDKQLEYSYFYSLGDIYLKQCVMGFGDSLVANKCYRKYKDNITFAFSGSAGVHIPKEEKKELKRLKSYLKNK
jgi:hypothetical protein